ncbi:MAG: HAD family phosphatase [Agarilytica sp.]
MLIIFDCDGVLVDSEVLSARILSQCLAVYDINMDEGECVQAFQGLTLKSCYEKIEKLFSLQLPAGFDEEVVLATQRGFDEGLDSVVGVEELIKELQSRGVPICVASNGSRKKIKHSLSLVGLEQYFSHCFSVDDVKVGKPDPAMFLHAAKAMKQSPKDVLVIEDSFAGYQAAKSAGMRCLVYAPSGKVGFECEEYFSDMKDVLPLLGK